MRVCKYKGCYSCTQDALMRADSAELRAQDERSKREEVEKENALLREKLITRLWTVKWYRYTNEFPKAVHEVQKIKQRIFTNPEAAETFRKNLDQALIAERKLHQPNWNEKDDHWGKYGGCGDLDVGGYEIYVHHGWEIEIRCTLWDNNVHPRAGEVHFE